MFVHISVSVYVYIVMQLFDFEVRYRKGQQNWLPLQDTRGVQRKGEEMSQRYSCNSVLRL